MADPYVCLSAIKREREYQGCLVDLRSTMNITENRYYDYVNFLNCETNITHLEQQLSDILVSEKVYIIIFDFTSALIFLHKTHNIFYSSSIQNFSFNSTKFFKFNNRKSLQTEH